MTWLQERAEQRHARGLQRTLRPRTVGTIDIASNDYLGLSHHPDVVTAGIAALEEFGAGATGSRLVSGHTTLHADLESGLAGLLGVPAALVFSSGYLANIAAVTALTDENTLLLCDAGNHASLIDAARLSGAHRHIYPSGDVDEVQRQLAGNPHKRAVVVTDAVYSVDGNLAPVAELADLCREQGALLIVDEAHSVGVLGDGAGVCAGLVGDTSHVVRSLTLSKALGSQGGAIAATDQIIEHVVNSARTFIFDTGLAPACVGSALAATQMILADPGLARRAVDSTTKIADIAEASGWEVFATDSAVVSVNAGSPQAAVAAQQVCADLGVAVGCFRPPSVPDGIARLRMTGHADLTGTAYSSIADALQKARSTLQELL
ncbi:MAG: 8-amino-7-oxononanoate synthase [Candidatus Nanopelagicales bacterium]|nr:8-amino-7-oxononanoate synthase [Candidatus Nanopelagicales bacterium]